MAYTPYHVDWKDYPDTTTPITSEAIEYIEAGIVNANASGAGVIAYSGSGAPSDSLGANGDFFLDIADSDLYGPKALGVWPSPTSLQGEAGTSVQIRVFRLNGAVAVGGTVLTLDQTTTNTWIKAGRYVVISAGTIRAELKSVTAISGVTASVSACKTAHSDNDLVIVLDGVTVTAAQCGLTGTGDEWGPIQRMLYEANELGLTMVGSTLPYQTSKPLLVKTNSRIEKMNFQTHSTYSPKDPNGALLQVALRAFPITANATTDTFSTVSGVTGMGGTGSDSEVNHYKVSFTNLYGETLPAPLVAGKVYYINTTPTTSTFTISATYGGAILDITSAGTGGMAFPNVEALSRTFWKDIRLDLTVADVNGLIAALQQPSHIDGLRIEMVACTVTTYGCKVGGQIGYIGNVEINPAANGIGMYIGSIGIVVNGFNAQGTGATGIALEINADATTVRDLWTESCSPCAVKISGGRGITLGGTWLYAASSITVPALLVTVNTASFEVPLIRNSNGSTGLIYSDTARGINLYSSNYVTDPSLQAADSGSVFGGLRQPAGAGAPTLKDRYLRSITANLPVAYSDEKVLVDSTAASRTVSLPAAAGWPGQQWTIMHWKGANTCTIDTTGAELIDGAASVPVPAGGTTIVMSDGTNFQIISERA